MGKEWINNEFNFSYGVFWVILYCCIVINMKFFFKEVSMMWGIYKIGGYILREFID